MIGWVHIRKVFWTILFWIFCIIRVDLFSHICLMKVDYDAFAVSLSTSVLLRVNLDTVVDTPMRLLRAFWPFRDLEVARSVISGCKSFPFCIEDSLHFFHMIVLFTLLLFIIFLLIFVLKPIFVLQIMGAKLNSPDADIYVETAGYFLYEVKVQNLFNRRSVFLLTLHA